jgi:hypothetical protein
MNCLCFIGRLCDMYMLVSRMPQMPLATTVKLIDQLVYCQFLVLVSNVKQSLQLLKLSKVIEFCLLFHRRLITRRRGSALRCVILKLVKHTGNGHLRSLVQPKSLSRSYPKLAVLICHQGHQKC